MPEGIKLLPCPACGNRAAVWIHDNQITYSVKCNSCGMSGPQTFIREVELSEMIDKATTAWNALPRALVWTKEPPKEAGQYYWALYQNYQNLVVGAVQVVRIHGELHAFIAGSKNQCPLSDFIQWAGPIPTPKEPEA